MKYLSVCSGIEGATAAWHPLGWEPVAFSEIERFPSAVLAHHYPGVPNWDDMTKYQEWPDAEINVLVGGTPCQSFSVAGLRQGMADPRGNLALVYLGIAERYRPQWLVWENVPGVLSSNGGRDFGAFLGGLGALGYGFAYRVLDAQYFGLAQRRKRVFVVGYLGDWRGAAAVLFEPESLCGDPAPSRESGERATHGAGRSSTGSRWPADVASTLDADFGAKHGQNNQHINGGCSLFVPEVSLCLNAGGMGRLDAESETLVPVAFGWQNSASQGDSVSEHITPTLDKSKTPAIATHAAVRRLTPRECERLQGFPDDFTAIPWRGKPADKCPDGPRYKALGNSMAVPCMSWIGRRIA